MTPERIAFYAEQAWPAGHEATSVRAIERAIRAAVNEFAEEAAKAVIGYGDGPYAPHNKVRALKLPEE